MGQWGLCDERCETCIYHLKTGFVFCDYIGRKNRPRPCGAGAGCTEYVQIEEKNEGTM